MKLRITDNAYKDNHAGWPIKDCCSSDPSQDDVAQILADIREIDSRSVNDLCEKKPNLLIFPHCLGEHKDGMESLYICRYSDERIYTGNLMGFVGVGETEIDIRSRFANKEDEDFFSHYMMQKVFCPNLLDFKHTISKESVFDFLLYLFPYYFNEALQQGVYKEYRRFEYNDSKVKGCIDVSMHIRSNIPFNGKIAYSTREYSYDNRITQLIRHTIEHIKSSPYGKGILSGKDTIANMRIITDCTTTYSLGNRRKVLADNSKEVRHPYFTKYTALQLLCKRILRHEELKYGNEEDKVYGILFDGAWLWEKYLNTLYSPLGITHADNKSGTNECYLFKGRTDDWTKRYPDFYSKDKGIVIDAKYKRLEGGKISRDDTHQIITYLHILQAKLAAVAYPKEEADGVSNYARIGELNGFGGEVGKFGLQIPNSSTYEDFIINIQNQEGLMQKEIQENHKRIWRKYTF